MVFPVSMGDVTKTVLHTLFLSECLRPCNRPALDAPGIWKKEEKYNFLSLSGSRINIFNKISDRIYSHFIISSFFKGFF
jgi:hypothetical protein